MYNYLRDKPQVGILSAISTNIILKGQALLTDDHILKLVSGVAVWAGMLVALLTLAAWCIKVTDLIKARKLKKP